MHVTAFRFLAKLVEGDFKLEKDLHAAFLEKDPKFTARDTASILAIL